MALLNTLKIHFVRQPGHLSHLKGNSKNPNCHQSVIMRGETSTSEKSRTKTIVQIASLGEE